ncbi:MAG TPA: glycosyltransferase family 4 protein [Drouetiella sp.]
MTRILLSPSAFHPSLGGVEEICRNLALQLKAKNFEVAVAVNRHPASLPEYEEISGIPIHRFDFEYPNRSLSGLGPLFRFPANAVKFSTFLNRFAPDLVHVICPSSNSLYCYLASAFFQQKTLVTLQGEFFMDATNIYERSVFARIFAERLLSVADGITACSQYVLDDAKKRFDFHCSLEKVVFNGVDLSEAKLKSTDAPMQKRFILGIGRLVTNKGFDFLLGAFARLAEVRDDVDLVLAGDGVAKADLENLSKELKIAERVHFVGRKDRAGVAALFAQCMFFVLPSPVEPFGIVCLEAMRAGKPTIATNTGGPPEFIHEEVNGMLVPPRDDQALFDAMARLCADDKLRNKLGKNAAVQVKAFDWQKITDQYVGLYENILKH